MAFASYSSSAARASTLVALSAVAWGCWWIPLRHIERSGLTGDWTSVVVLSTAALCLAPFVFARFGRLVRAGPMVWGAGFFLGVMFSTYQHGLIAGDVVRVTLLFYLAPVWGTLLGLIFLGERFSRRRVAVIVLGFAGVAVILNYRGVVPTPQGLGEWMGLASGIAFAIGATFAYRVVGEYGLEKSWLSLASGAGLSMLFALANPAYSLPAASQVLQEIPFVIAIVVFILIPITWAMVWGAQRLDPGRISLLLMLEVVAASISATWLAGEPYGMAKAVGTVMILAAGAVETLTKRVARPAGPLGFI
ncbi:MAG: DMT family transporter [Hyphomicrobiales bacterium]|nr:DMT family transporter [Hyphomicrobiales bacterium]MCP4998790.1 DMT family transporter [Hyphomicrobiales bacterium]